MGGAGGGPDRFSSSPGDSNVQPERRVLSPPQLNPQPTGSQSIPGTTRGTKQTGIQLIHKCPISMCKKEQEACDKKINTKEKITRLKSQAKMKRNKVAVTKVLTSFSSINICYLQGRKPKRWAWKEEKPLRGGKQVIGGDSAFFTEHKIQS